MTTFVVKRRRQEVSEGGIERQKERERKRVSEDVSWLIRALVEEALAESVD